MYYKKATQSSMLLSTSVLLLAGQCYHDIPLNLKERNILKEAFRQENPIKSKETEARKNILKDLGGLKDFTLSDTSDFSRDNAKKEIVKYLNKKLNENRNASLRKYRFTVLNQWEYDQSKYVCQIGSRSLRNIFDDVLTRGKLKEATFESIDRLRKILGVTPASYEAFLNFIIEVITTRYCIEQFITLYQGNAEALKEAVERELECLVSAKEWKKGAHKYGIITKTGGQEAGNASYEIILISDDLVTQSTRPISICLKVSLTMIQEQMQKFQNPPSD